ncbi:DMP19 family protein [Rhodopirellula europaea]|uniref:DNA mimic protein DMP19 C-terminal domain-containing protein n=1 Tax=Rhodopirellula europaea 6C TaxID=1263867 RepID=M2AAF9_9BACT|nr:DUF4375 domain-containing protein [Rhodopirellula europaea]EMB13465.1 hypothetical protein RE6C_05823 [Rhodopirellula europaea 6C]
MADQVFERIDAVIGPATDPKAAVQDLQALPPGYALCYAFQHVHAEILNGGISQLYSNSAWSLILQAEEAARQAGVSRVSNLLREIVFYYHQRNRSKHKRSLAEDYFASLPSNWDKSLKQLDDDFFCMEQDANSVILRLCCDNQELFTDA